MNKPPQMNLDLFLEINKSVYGSPTPPKSVNEARKEMYFLKVIDLIWFDGLLENNRKGQQDFYLNTNWPTEPPPDGMPGISALDETALEWICKRMKRPVWADKKHLVRDFNFLDIIKKIKS